METTNDARVLPNDAGPARISRRELAQIFLTSLAADILLPLSSSAHPIRRHLLNGRLLDFADVHLSARSKPLFLSARQVAALDVLSEAVVPGSRKAQTASFIDLLLSVDTHEVQQDFLAALSAADLSSHNTYHAEIVALSPTQLHELLTTLSASHSAEYKHFTHLKDWISAAYYSSEIGMREMGWTPNRVFPTFPVCSHRDGHV